MKTSIADEFLWGKLTTDTIYSMELSSDEQYLFIVGFEYVARINSEDGAIVNYFEYFGGGNFFESLDISDTKLLITGDFTFVFDINTFTPIL